MDGPNLSRAQFINLGTSLVSLQGTGTSVQGVVLSPNAKVQMTAGCQFYGSLFGQSVSITSASGLHEDRNITKGPDPVMLSPAATYRVDWMEPY